MTVETMAKCFLWSSQLKLPLPFFEHIFLISPLSSYLDLCRMSKNHVTNVHFTFNQCKLKPDVIFYLSKMRYYTMIIFSVSCVCRKNKSFMFREYHFKLAQPFQKDNLLTHIRRLNMHYLMTQEFQFKEFILRIQMKMYKRASARISS